MGGEHPHQSVYMLQHFINNAFQNLNYQRLSVASVLLFCVIALALGLCWAVGDEKGGGPVMKKRPSLWAALAGGPAACGNLRPLRPRGLSQLCGRGPQLFPAGVLQRVPGSSAYLSSFWRTLFLCAVMVAGQVVLSIFAGLGLPSFSSPGRTCGFFCCWW